MLVQSKVDSNNSKERLCPMATIIKMRITRIELEGSSIGRRMAGRFFSLGLLTPTLNCVLFQTKRLWRSMQLIRELSVAVSLRRKRIP